MNRVELIGNVTMDAELKQSKSGTYYTTLYLAVRRKYPNKDGNEIVDFHECVAFNKLAEYIAKNVKKGNKLFVAGELIYDTYIDSKDNKKIIPKITIEQVEFLSPKTKVESVEGKAYQEELKPLNLTDDSLPF